MAGTAGEEERSPRGLGWRMALFYGALFIVYGTHVPFTPVWLSSLGLTAGDIALIMSVPLFLRIFATPAIALAADRFSTHREFMIVLAWLAFAIVLALSQVATFWPVMLLMVPLIVTNSSMMPLAETLAVRGVREAGLDYGRIRLWGSLTFIAASFLGGILIDRWGAGLGIWLVALGCLATLAAAHTLPRFAPGAPPVTPPSPLWHAREPRQLLASRPFVAFLVAAGGAQAAHATMLAYGTLIWQQQGLSAGVSGALWAVAVLAEVILFAYAVPLLARFSAARMLVLAAAVSVARWAFMAFDPPLAILVPLQALHAITYGGSHIGAIYFIAQAVPARMQGSAQALYATMASGVAMGSATLASGHLLAAKGSALAYAAMAGLGAIALLGALMLLRCWDGGHVVAEDVKGHESAPPSHAAADA